MPGPRPDNPWNADRVRAIPATVVSQVEGLLDRVAARAVSSPLEVRTVDDARERLQAAPAAGGGAVSWAAALAGRTKRSLTWRGRAIPISVAAKLGSEVVSSFRLGAYELEVLASLLVHRLREADLPVDARAVQRAVVNVYVSPGRDAGTTRRPEVASASLAALWVGRMMSVEPAVGRVTKAADALLRLDRPALARVAAG